MSLVEVSLGIFLFVRVRSVSVFRKRFTVGRLSVKFKPPVESNLYSEVLQVTLQIKHFPVRTKLTVIGFAMMRFAYF